jgi:gliding motility-associated-like protein
MKPRGQFSVLLLFIFLAGGSSLRAQNERWIELEGANSNYTPQNQSYNANDCNDVAVNNRNHDVYIAGHFSYNSIFGSTAYSPGGGPDGFIIRYDSAGNFIWSKQIVSSNLMLSGIAVDSAGNSYVCGMFQGDVNFGNGLYTSPWPGDFEFFIASYDMLGNFRWEHHHHPTAVYSSTGNMANDVAVSNDGHVYYTGSFRGTITIANQFLSSVPYLFSMGLLVAKLDTLGNYEWAYGTILTDDRIVGNGIAIDAQGDALVTGYYDGGIRFTPTDSIYTANSSEQEMFVAKISSAGAYVWAKRVRWTTGTDIAVDLSGNAYVTGTCGDSVYFGSQAVGYPGNNYSRLHVMKFDASGNYVWSAVRDSAYGKGIAVADDGAPFVLGSVADFVTPIHSFDIVCKFDASGLPVWEKIFPYIGGGSVHGMHNGIARDGCSVIIADSFWNNAAPDTNAYTPVLTADIFVAKLGDSSSTCCAAMQVDAASVYVCDKGEMLQVNGSAGTITWSTGDTTGTIIPSSAAVYSVTISQLECKARDSVYFSAEPASAPFYIPNAFTPNSDGLNETFGPVGINATNYTFRIFNRWGELIFETNDPAVLWNGTYKNEIVQSDIYVWTIDYESECTFGEIIHQNGMVVLLGKSN